MAGENVTWRVCDPQPLRREAAAAENDANPVLVVHHGGLGGLMGRVLCRAREQQRKLLPFNIWKK